MSEEIQQKIDNFFAQFTQRTYKKGEILIRAGDDPSGIFFLKKGMIKEYAISTKGDEVVINLFKPHSFFPMSWAINQTPNTYFFEAVSDALVEKAPRESVVAFVKNNPDVLFDLVSRVFNGVDGVLKRMVNLMSASAYARLITELEIYGKRFGDTKKTGITTPITETKIASQTGMSRETVSREMKKLKDKGIVSIQNSGILIHSLEKLEAELISLS